MALGRWWQLGLLQAWVVSHLDSWGGEDRLWGETDLRGLPVPGSVTECLATCPALVSAPAGEVGACLPLEALIPGKVNFS